MQSMFDQRAAPTEPARHAEDTLAHISGPAFIAAWKAMVGEPPTTMLDSRSEMIRVLVASTPAALVGDMPTKLAEGYTTEVR